MFGRFRFLDPYRCAAANIAREGATYLTDFIEEVGLDSLVFLPYHEGFEITQLYFNKKYIYKFLPFVLVGLDGK
ncbi:hypothetical protein GCM10007854_30720 [Algimonas porphyrae]|uniref:Uncharacterized protein n=1 Tax=Algimonas porphyrae TaxID=1128113 RepID=A0ABQ5V6B2_9PROT|nr:hypothetical protein GCM10007854_30720 [Algimonas porphyrae]